MRKYFEGQAKQPYERDVPSRLQYADEDEVGSMGVIRLAK